MYDTVIIGAGAAGLSAAIYAARRAMKTLLLSVDIGGQTATTPAIENYPGFESIDGLELMMKFKEQAEKSGSEVKLEEVQAVERKPDGTFTVRTASNTYDTQTVIFTHGLKHRHLGVPGEDSFSGKGVSYCATCDAPLFKKKVTAVVGGGSAAVDAAILLAKLCPKVYLIHRKEKFRAEEVLLERLKTHENIELHLNRVVKEIKGEQTVKSVVIANVKDSTKTRELEIAGLFVEIGFEVDDRLMAGLVELTEQKAIKISRECETSVPGIFAAGDVTTVKYKQTVIAAGEGATAALQAYAYLLKKKGKPAVFDPDRTTAEDVERTMKLKKQL